jgi:hypothetical protein
MNSIYLHEKGMLVLRWQFFLLGTGFNKVKATGTFDMLTFEATKKFQRLNKIIEDGVAGNETFQCAMKKGFELVVDTKIFNQLSFSWPAPPLFKNLTPYQMQHKFGLIKYIDSGHGVPEYIDDWQEANLIKIHVPELEQYKIKGKCCELIFHKKVANQVSDLFNRWAKHDLLHLVESVDETFSPRYIRGYSGILSAHAFGVAFHINSKWNKLGCIPAAFASKGSVRELVKIANECGFYWGGHFPRREGMHFEVARVLYNQT